VHSGWQWQGNNALGSTGATSLARALEKLTGLIELNLVGWTGLKIPFQHQKFAASSLVLVYSRAGRPIWVTVPIQPITYLALVQTLYETNPLPFSTT
jgi:hypothetical protein